MATLSANSRRNSSTSSQGSSPRPSISGSLVTHTTSRMTSVNEEDGVSDNTDGKLKVYSVKFKNKSCTERSDSGFSECSSCSVQSIICGCNKVLLNKSNKIVEENQADIPDSPQTLSPDLLQSKLDIIAKNQRNATTTDEEDMTPTDEPANILHVTKNDNAENEIKNLNSKNILPSTFQLRKQSLENNIQKYSGISKPTPIIKTNIKTNGSGKVSQLKEKFSQSAPTTINTKEFNKSPSKSPSIKSSIDSLFSSSDDGVLTNTSKTSSRKLGTNIQDNTRSNKSGLNTLNEDNNSKLNCMLDNSEIYTNRIIETPKVSNKIANLKLKFSSDETNRTATAATTGFTRTPIRLSGRIKEVTDRLSQPKQTNTSSTKTMHITKGNNANIIPNAFKTVNQKDNFKKVAAFWER